MLWWWIWVPLRPFQYLLAIISLGDFAGVEPPRRMRFFEGKKLKPDFRPERHEFLEVRDERCDLRVAAALLMLINSRDTDILNTSPHEYTP